MSYDSYETNPQPEHGGGSAQNREPATVDATPQQSLTEIFKALSDPIRWDIIAQMAAVDELACVTLEETLPVSKPTISYHTKILYHAGLIDVRKSGRNYYYSLRRDVIEGLMDSLWQLAPTPRPVVREEDGHVAMGRRQKRGEGHALTGPARKRRTAAARENVEEAVVLTW
jgi:DNA-binding transcriptional ArsR family regulator